MLDNLSDRLGNVFDRLKGRGALSENDVREAVREIRIALAERDGTLIPLINEKSAERYILERHLCVDTTAAGGNASLIATVED